MNKLKLTVCEIRKHEKVIKIAATVAVVMVAVLFFAMKGESETISVEDNKDISTEDTTTENDNSSETIFVDLDGAVKKPGVYELKNGCRIYEVIEKAGGLTDDADTSTINQAEVATDGQKIIIPYMGESLNVTSQGNGVSAANDLVNINSADSTRLQEIPGVGPSTADKIITYRQNNGNFKSKEDIKNVNGIGEKTYKKMEAKITV